ncbi:acyltransferase [Mesorhizobium sp. M1D.F.Ca.ET.184.01.1.1]|nr:acyltransferase [Mesorhizobium sp. M1D.F.Ca.ET.231.01.1.1]TGP32043.1 acyltransferase [Mesorhizobium sp. M1D.F.Ca.ET.234.01.1.1]TGS46506.1 acyltransferase [Mesorhizobium sp. M1D.F.Ca.ET.184.01.1.1]TGS61333.1 acyltransferase [Mesorhizobium sp. M1D.F.Ca.ET.183.01.1.1]TIT80015.1 MAG: acyltransferase [Mesorhizobium sp.]
MVGLRDAAVPPGTVVKFDYRPDVDGLRAIAVIAVILFHFGVPGFPGGFVGVDIFFVISGYLITRLLVAEGRELSLVEFYGRRMRRILPAMLVVITLSLVAGWFLLLPGDYSSLGRSAAFSAAGLGNYYFLWNTSYFDREATLLPLLHLWSLGVEEQFYLVWPALLMAASRLPRGGQSPTIAAICLVAVASFSIALHLVAVDPKQAFYGPFSRAWELALGGLMVFVPPVGRRIASEAFGLLGLCLIAASIVWLSPSQPFPGLSALVPVIGAVSLIWPRSHSIPSDALSSWPLRFTGKISYSLYLWHWPILVFFRHYTGGAMPMAVEASALIAAAWLVAYLSWRFVEEPARRLRPPPLRAIVAGVTAALVVGLGGNAVFEADGFTSRIPQKVEAMRSLDVMWNWPCPQMINIPELGSAFCGFGAPWEKAARHAVLWGDSHAEHLVPPLDEVGKAEDTAFFLYHACPAALGEGVHRDVPELPNYQESCTASRKAVVSMLRRRPDIDLVVLSSAWTSLAYTHIVADDGPRADKVLLLRDGLRSLIEEIDNPDRRIGIIGQVPGPGLDLTSCAVMRESGMLRRCSTEMDSERILRVWSPMVTALGSLAEEEGVFFVDPLKGMCRNRHCATYVNGEFIYRDASHMRRNLKPETFAAIAQMIGLYRAAPAGDEQTRVSATNALRASTTNDTSN